MIDGRDAADVINGDAGNDYLYGGVGNDTIFGGAGNDTLIGSYGSKTLTGDGGSDIFVVRQGTFATIADFNPAEDQIWVWVDTLDTIGSTTLGTAAVDYDQNTGFLSVNNSVIAFLDGQPRRLTKSTVLGNFSNPDIFVT